MVVCIWRFRKSYKISFGQAVIIHLSNKLPVIVPTPRPRKPLHISATKAYFQRFKSFHHLLSTTNFLKLPTEYYGFFVFLYTNIILNFCVCEGCQNYLSPNTHVIYERLSVQIISYTPNMAKIIPICCQLKHVFKYA